ncbi:hypothetical protein T484DRAFT_1747455 [Baffinella frigidus]|nr:hypothetical protein T484DRAFT_1747455 [Cryptophyta sp. CCMP2293]
MGDYATRTLRAELLAEGRMRPVTHTPPVEVKQILTMEDFAAAFGTLCKLVHDTLGPFATESMVQASMIAELRRRGVVCVPKAAVHVNWHETPIGVRESNFVVQTTQDGKLAVIELKTAATLTRDNRRQLEFYMRHLDINRGFLVNIPTESSWPEGHASTCTTLAGPDLTAVLAGNSSEKKKSSATAKMHIISAIYPEEAQDEAEEEAEDEEAGAGAGAGAGAVIPRTEERKKQRTGEC